MKLESQCLAIGLTYILISLTALLFTSYDIHHPLHSVDMEKIRPLHPGHTPPPHLYQNSTDSSEDLEPEVEMETNTNELEKIVLDLAHSMRMNGVVFLLAWLTTLSVSSLLVYGIRKDKSNFLFLWAVIQALMTFTIIVANFTGPQPASVLKTIMMFFYFLISVYSIISVYSFHMIIKIQKRSVIRFLDQEFQPTEGGFYRPVDEERPVTPFREKSVPMTDQEDVDREHVLYAKM